MVFTSEAFRLMQIQIGKASIDARPIEWNEEDWDGTGHNKDGDSIQPTHYMTVCPHCSQGFKFHVDDIKVVDILFHVRCTECGVGEVDDYKEEEDVPYVEIPFIDPIEVGVLMSANIIKNE